MPSGSGHPDWQAYAQWRSGALINIAQNVSPGVPLITDPVNVSNWESLLVIASATTKGANMQFQTAPSVDTPSANWAIQQLFTLPAASNNLHGQLTPLDRAVRFRFTDADAVTATFVSLQVYGINIPSVPGAVRFSDNMASIVNTNFANNQVVLLPTPIQGSSRAQLVATVPAGTAAGFNVNLWTMTAAGATDQLVASIRSVTSVLNTSLVVPPLPLVMQMQNATGGAVNGVNGSIIGAY